MKRTALLLTGLYAAVLLSSCANTSKTTYEGAAAGAAVGAVAGAILDEENRWRGGVIGATIGAVFGATITEIARRAAEEAAQANKPVVYTSEDNTQMVRAEPLKKEGNCTVVVTKYYQNGELVKVEEKKVCS
ncbi:MAG: glycine zipper 2TM domain-containing protein [Aquificae bacterium]|nr:glycine zipper 2TM domain-containing protein [Aquificota bacterium]